MPASLLTNADALLRGHDWATRSQRALWAVPQLIVLIVFSGLGYGAVMGTFSGLEPERLLQIVYSALKVPLLLGATFALSLPSFFVLNTLLGVRNDFGEAIRALMATQAGLSMILLSLAPFTALWYLSNADYEQAVLFNGVMFGAASLAAQIILRRYYAPLIARNPRHRVLLRSWLGLYAFVGIQMGWILRPFIGYPGMEVQFFRSDTWGNAYLIVGESIWHLFTH